VETYLAELTRRLAEGLGGDLVGVYLMGSTAMGAHVEGVSDVDVWALVRRRQGRERTLALAGRVDQAALPCPARGLELVVARFAPDRSPVVEMNLNDGPRMPRRLSVGPGGEAGHWFVLDAAIGRERGRALAGPPPREAFPRQPRSAVLAAIAASLDWHARHEPEGPNALLNALRGWRYATEGVWGSKEEAARWSLARRPGWAREVEAALAARAAPAP
jgi:hypothetical protein